MKKPARLSGGVLFSDPTDMQIFADEYLLGAILTRSQPEDGSPHSGGPIN